MFIVGENGMVQVAWQVLLGAAAVLAIVVFVFGALMARKFGTNWLAMITWMVGPDELKALAYLAWDAGIVPATWKRIRFKDDSTVFVEWVVKKAEELGVWKTLLDVRAAKMGVGIRRPR